MTNHTKKGIRAAQRVLWLLALPAVLLSTACQDAGPTSEAQAPQLGIHVDNPVPPNANPSFETLILCKEWTNAADIATDFDVTVDDLKPGGTSTTLTRTLTDTGSRECREVAQWDGTTNFAGPANLQTVEILPANTNLLNIVVTAVDPAGNVVDATGAPYFSTIDVAKGTWSAKDADQFIGFRVEYFNELVPLVCEECKGGVTELTLQFTGASGSLVEIEDDNVIIFSQILDDGDQFTINGSKSDGKFQKNDLKVFVNGTEVAKIHVSCSKPIGPGAVFGDLTVVQAFSKDFPGIEVCPVPPPPGGNGDLCTTIGKPEKLVLEYDDTAGCTFANAQDPGKWVCDDLVGAPYPNSVDWKAGDKDKASDNDADRFGSGTATSPPGGYVVADALLNGDDHLKGDTKIHLLDGGNPIRFIKMHTSCSQPLRLDDVFGGLRLVGYVAEKGQGQAGIVP